MTIRPAVDADWPHIWELFRAVCAAGDSFAYDADTPEAVARKLWFDPPATALVAEENGTFLGTYYLRPNQPGRGSHVANGGYMVSEAARGRGPGSGAVEADAACCGGSAVSGVPEARTQPARRAVPGSACAAGDAARSTLAASGRGRNGAMTVRGSVTRSSAGSVRFVGALAAGTASLGTPARPASSEAQCRQGSASRARRWPQVGQFIMMFWRQHGLTRIRTCRHEAGRT